MLVQIEAEQAERSYLTKRGYRSGEAATAYRFLISSSRSHSDSRNFSGFRVKVGVRVGVGVRVRVQG